MFLEKSPISIFNAGKEWMQAMETKSCPTGGKDESGGAVPSERSTFLEDQEANPVEISVVIPAYNELIRLPPTLRTVEDYLKNNFSKWQIIVADDGSTDGSVEQLEPQFPNVYFLRAPRNQGKGAAVRRGMLAAQGRLVLFSDADLSTPIDELEGMKRAILEGPCDVAIASRGLPESKLEVRQPWWRELSGRTFNLLVRLLSGLPFHDTQCGFKLFTRKSAREIFSRMQSDRWAFDVEALMIARLLNFQVRECPVRWINAEGSKIKLSRDAPRMLADIIRFRLRLRKESGIKP